MQVRSWLIRLILAGTLLTGCNASSDFDRQKTTPMAEPTYLSGVTINASTVGRLDGGWSVGVQWVSNEEDYVDAEGKAQRGRLARISVWNDTLGKNDILEVYEGMIFSVV